MLHKVARWALPLILLDASLVLGTTLVPIRPGGGGRYGKRNTVENVDVLSQETFLWGSVDGDEISVANLTVYMPEDSEGILNMERFDDMLNDIKCDENSIEMVFKDDATFAYAQEVWDWVNGAENSSFVMVAGVGDCGNNTRRLPYVVSSLQYDEEANKATLAARLSEWQDVAHSYEFTVGSISDDNITESGLERRDLTKDTSINFNHKLPFSVAISSQGLEARLACLDCSSSGSFNMEFRVKQKLLVPTGASMKIRPKGVSAKTQVKLSGSIDVKDSLTKEFDILEIPISGLKIPGVLDLGPFLTVSVGAEFSAISLTAGITTGATFKLDDAAVLEVNLLDPKKNKFSGWTPQVDLLETKVDASISGGVAVFLKPFLNLQAEALGRGFALGINMKIPNISAKMAAVTSPQGVCPDSTKTAGVKLTANIGGSLNFAVKKTNDADPLFNIQLAAIDRPFAQKCFPFGPEKAARALSHPHYREISAA
ncbi:hypothetical protein B0J11DRAFT_53660 [Dendryphion nanum]|uniref:Uncharacterized protein n=1 Tax=Dendryphion nanum TaxID=256645 RepID=A0A9P9DL51_9PLEO|nr:hypothetical protein B0J11DRAFT_53660 [Dendryphion nanum]